MISATSCIYLNREIHIDEALQIRKANKRLPKGTFRCIECRQPVRLHAASKKKSNRAHIEHCEKNDACSYSVGESAVNRKNNEQNFEMYEADDPRAVEGQEQDRMVIARSRNPQIARQRKKRDDYTCQACGLRLEIQGRFIIECHHLNPVSVAGVTEISLNDLVSLCPTCHRIAHTRSEPYSVQEIRALRQQNDNGD